MNYEASLKRKRDAESVRLTQERIGREKGLKEGLEKGLKKGMEKGMEKGRTEGIEEGLEKGMEKGLRKGLEEGREEEKKAMVAKLKALGMSLENISQVTGLSVEEIEKL